MLPLGTGWQGWRKVRRDHARRSAKRHKIGTQNGQRIPRIRQAQDIADFEIGTDERGKACVADGPAGVGARFESHPLALPRSVCTRERWLEHQRTQSQAVDERCLGLRDELIKPETRGHVRTAGLSLRG
jgi:hypothetical protein